MLILPTGSHLQGQKGDANRPGEGKAGLVPDPTPAPAITADCGPGPGAEPQLLAKRKRPAETGRLPTGEFCGLGLQAFKDACAAARRATGTRGPEQDT